MTASSLLLPRSILRPLATALLSGADGGFTLYEDDGETYRYERGERATTALRSDDARRTLHIAARQGRYRGMVTRRELLVRVMASPGQTEQTRSVQYEGRALSLHLGSSHPTQ